jgi:hypothetical protein
VKNSLGSTADKAGLPGEERLIIVLQKYFWVNICLNGRCITLINKQKLQI